ncbi:transposase [Prevotella sp. E13-17]|uniref:ISAon1 family transposase N-terminal region protein n=1 Tax=Prevotella sp. E13-17 TaxID=2913616 RepID=UPI001EDA602B|nr:transposase [Prevotella sp. E13-17]UKK51799.1 transposase [Prevotella sp. E13-17]
MRPNGFTPAKTFHDFPIRGLEVLLHVRRRRWLDTENHNVMSEFDFIQESTRCSKELADFLKKRLETLPITARSFEKDYHINGDNFERSYKEGGRLNGFKRTGPISGFKTWEDAEGKPIHSNAAYHPERLKNNETKAELLMRSKYLLMVSPEKWTPNQRERAEILFELYPDIETAYSLTHSLRMIFAQKCDKEAGRKSIKKWYAKVSEFDNKAFNDIAAAMYDREDEILNYFVNRSTNASAGPLNAKIKDFRAQLRGVIDKKFFIFRLVKIFS